MTRDQYWDDLFFEMPYTAAAEEVRKEGPGMGATMDVEIKEKDATFLPKGLRYEDDDKEANGATDEERGDQDKWALHVALGR